MANYPSAKKRIRQTAKRTARNKHVRTTTRTLVKRVRKAIKSGDSAEANKWLGPATKQIDRAVAKGVLHRKTGARYVSRLSRQVADPPAVCTAVANEPAYLPEHLEEHGQFTSVLTLSLRKVRWP